MVATVLQGLEAVTISSKAIYSKLTGSVYIHLLDLHAPATEPGYTILLIMHRIYRINLKNIWKPL